ncbi:hypothetical protein QJS66_00915 [Kocuria rhizophila]|nr:hypothetical protein QJS66_00915 [Kocuria rhizophila]
MAACQEVMRRAWRAGGRPPLAYVKRERQFGNLHARQRHGRRQPGPRLRGGRGRTARTARSSREPLLGTGAARARRPRRFSSPP